SYSPKVACMLPVSARIARNPHLANSLARPHAVDAGDKRAAVECQRGEHSIHAQIRIGTCPGTAAIVGALQGGSGGESRLRRLIGREQEERVRVQPERARACVRIWSRCNGVGSVCPSGSTIST